MPQTMLIVDDHAGFHGFANQLMQAGGYTMVAECHLSPAALVQLAGDPG